MGRVSFLFMKDFHYPSEVTNTPTGNRFRIGIEREDLDGDIAPIAILSQRFQDGRESGFSEPRPLSIGIIDVDMAQMARPQS